MRDLFAFHYTGEPFELFSPAHILAVLFIIIVNVGLALWLRSGPAPRMREALRYGLAVVCLLQQPVWDAWQLAVGIWSPQYSLPLHLCMLATILCGIMLLMRSYGLYEVLYFWVLAGATQALLTPDLQIYGFPHFRFWIFFTAHGAILSAVVFMTFAYSYRPTWASIGRVVLVTNTYLLFVGIVNFYTGGNYMFVAHKPAFPSLIDYLGPWPWYILILQLIGVVLFVLCYLPFALSDRRRRRAAQEHPRLAQVEF